MTIQEIVKKDLLNAMRKKDVKLRDLLRVVTGEFNRIDKVLTDDQTLPIIKKMYDNAIEFNNEDEASMLSFYIPKQMTKDQLTVTIQKIILDNIEPPITMKHMGVIMKTLKNQHSGSYDGQMASNIIKSIL